MTSAASRRELWREALRQPAVWRRALKLGLITGLVQAAVNQGDVWLHHAETAGTVLKTILSPVISLVLVLVAAAEMWVQKTLEQKIK
ncbi:MAG: hypothetical protein JF609_06305 [Verrucomicrobia bacterium]|nr:hypothetical protein [Verrucomicrobiota bacterium]